ncbi:hypothetical protein BaRGS_00028814, partial [Batillaria attramentaria]
MLKTQRQTGDDLYNSVSMTPFARAVTTTPPSTPQQRPLPARCTGKSCGLLLLLTRIAG